MRQHILLVASETQIRRAKATLTYLGAKETQDRAQQECFELQPQLLQEWMFRIHFLSSIDGIVPHLKRSPVDLLIYDERDGASEAIQAIRHIRKDIESFSKLWGHDFEFPLSRSVVILKAVDASQRIFQLGQEHIKDVLVEPRSIGTVLRWIGKIWQGQRESEQRKVGCALSGGGMEGFLYQLGSTYALQRALSGRSIENCELFSGISSGSIVASALAAGVPLEEAIRSLYGKSEIIPNFTSSLIYDIAGKSILKRILKESSHWGGLDPVGWVEKAMRSVPTGFFKGEKFKDYIEKTLNTLGKGGQFSDLECELYIGATNQDSFEHVVFGQLPWDKVPISEAVRASCALPPFFTPMTIDGKNYIDGLITKTCNLELMVRKGCKLIIILDPMTPYISWETGAVDQKGGIYTLIQTVKMIVHSRFRASLEHLTEKYPSVDFIIFQPFDDCAKAMAGSPMKYRIRPDLIELSYRNTIKRLRERYSVYKGKLSKYGFEITSQRRLLELEKKGFSDILL